MRSDPFIVCDLSGIREGFSVSVVRRPVTEMAKIQHDAVRIRKMSMQNPKAHPLSNCCNGAEAGLVDVKCTSSHNGHLMYHEEVRAICITAPRTRFFLSGDLLSALAAFAVLSCAVVSGDASVIVRRKTTTRRP